MMHNYEPIEIKVAQSQLDRLRNYTLEELENSLHRLTVRELETIEYLLNKETDNDPHN